MKTEYDKWIKERSIKEKRDVSKDKNDYDIQGAFLEMRRGKMKQDSRGHLGDKYKKPNHPTFSTESIYSKGETIGGKWIKGANNEVIGCAPSKYNLDNMSKEQLKRYFDRVEPNIKLIME